MLHPQVAIQELVAMKIYFLRFIRKAYLTRLIFIWNYFESPLKIFDIQDCVV